MKTSTNYKDKSNFYSLDKENNNDKNCCLKFSQCDENKYQLWELGKDELKTFISYAKKVEKIAWQDILHHKGLNFEKLSNMPIPEYIDKSVGIYSMRVDKKFRIIGYRSEFYFYILWFDNNHETC